MEKHFIWPAHKLKRKPCLRVWHYILGKVLTFQVRRRLHWDQELLASYYWQGMSSLNRLRGSLVTALVPTPWILINQVLCMSHLHRDVY